MKLKYKNILTLFIYFINLPLYLFSLLIPRNKNIWIFGARQGNSYSENPKYLFEYINKNHKGIKSIWLSRNSIVIKDLRNKGHRAYHLYSIYGYWFSIRAKIIIFSSLKFVPSDLNYYVWNKRASLIQLWHGTPIKKIIYDNPNSKFGKNNIYHRLLNLIFPFHRFLSRVELTKTIASSQIVQSTLSHAFKMKIEDIPITGYPKNDYVIKKNKDFNPDKNKNIIFLPTWREEDFLIFEKYLFDADKIDKFCSKNNFIFNIKLHPYSLHYTDKLKKLIKNRDNIKLIDHDDIYEIIHQFDILITDYSSIIFDYLLLNRPIIFSFFDIEKFKKDDSGFYFNLSEISPGSIVYNWDQLLKALKANIKNHRLFNNERMKICKKFNKFNDTKNSERVFNEILKLTL